MFVESKNHDRTNVIVDNCNFRGFVYGFSNKEPIAIYKDKNTLYIGWGKFIGTDVNCEIHSPLLAFADKESEIYEHISHLATKFL